MPLGVEPLDAVGIEEHLDALAQLLLDAHEGTDADRIYERLGWTRAGVIPEYAELPNGELTGNAFYFLRLPNID